jgi:hypothetical protein
MGLSGLMVACTSQAPQNALPELGAPVDTQEGPMGYFLSTFVGGPLGESDLAQRLAESLGTPTLVAHVLDSDLARIDAGSLKGFAWSAFINPAVAESSYPGVVPDGYAETLPAIAESVVQWVNEAVWSYTIAAPSVQELFEREHVVAEDGVRDVVIELIGYGRWGGSLPELDIDELLRPRTPEELEELREQMRRTGIEPMEDD